MSGPPVFRQRPVDAAAGTQFSEALNTYWIGARLFTWLAIVMTALVVVSLSIIEYAPIHRMPAVIDSRAGVSRVTAPVNARIATLLMTEGGRVASGDPVLLLDTRRDDSNGGTREDQLRRDLVAATKSTRAEIAAARLEAHATITRLELRRAGIERQLTEVHHGLAALGGVETALRTYVDELRGLVDEGYAARSQLRISQNEVASQQARSAVLRAQVAQLEGDRDQIRMEMLEARARESARVEASRRTALELERLQVETRMDAGRLLRAPSSGSVSFAGLRPGQVVRTGEALFSVAPVADTYVVKVSVPSSAVAAIHVGSTFPVALAAFPKEQFGFLHARVMTLSRATFAPAGPQPRNAPGEASYLAIAELRPDPRVAAGGLSLRPDMAAEAFVPGTRRSLGAFIVAPLAERLGLTRPQ